MPASETRYWVGTSGWQYDHWRGGFYPRDLAKKDWFDHYAASFPCVEVNNSFYHQPVAAVWDDWHDAAPEGFRFAVKANRYLTHMKRFKDAEEPLKRFLAGAERLKAHLGPLLYQAPPQFQCSGANLERLDVFLGLLPRHLQHVIEFRHKSWYNDDTLDLLRRHEVALCVHDLRDVESPVVATARHAYFRFHGVGPQTYAGNYPDAALRDWAVKIRDLEGVGEVWAFFNNDLGGHAINNALTLAEMLQPARTTS